MTDEKEKSNSAPDDTEQNPEETEQPGTSVVLKNLSILPPLQKKGTLNRDEIRDRVSLPPIRAEEPVSSIRAALGEVCGYSHLTNYRFELESPLNAPGKSTGDIPAVSPYTGTDAVVSVPVALKSLGGEEKAEENHPCFLDDYGDLTLLLDKGLQDGSAFRIVLERYDIAQIRDHVGRLRSLLEGNAPSVTTLDDDSGDPRKEEPSENHKNGESNSSKQESSDEKKTNGKKETKTLPVFPEEKPVAIDSSELKDFYYLVCGEDASLYRDMTEKSSLPRNESGSKGTKKKGKNGNNAGHKGGETSEKPTAEQIAMEIIPQLNKLEEQTRVSCKIQLSGFHPPPRSRRLMGDLAYLEVLPPGTTEPIHITAIPTGFYVNRSKSSGEMHQFDPSPAAEPCFSHELLDCLCQASKSFLDAWTIALSASKRRAELMAKLNEDGPFASLFRIATRGDFSGYTNPSSGSAAEGIDNLLQTPSWIVPISQSEMQSKESWNRNSTHSYNPASTEDDLGNSFGIDMRNGTVRDWNEELQSAREMPDKSLAERIERARIINKTLTDFGDASLQGIKAICDGQIAPMNPNEPSRSQVYLHNNIFFSRAIDAGIETFKIAKGDKAARKSASRDVHCLGSLHRMEKAGLYTLATVLVDYLGTRFVCQSILPGILSGEKSHTLLYGTVEAGFPLTWDKDMHELLEDTLGKFWIANRPLPRQPLTEERVSTVQASKVEGDLSGITNEEVKSEDKAGPTVNMCGPIEAKGIKGSDQRKYVLDLTRLTPRDANWVEETKGGTGKWESLLNNGASSKSQSKIPTSLNDDEWTLSVLRPELVNNYAQINITKYMTEKKQKEEKKKKEGEKEDSVSKEGKSTGDNEEEKEGKDQLTDEDRKYFETLRLNVNVFLPDIKSLDGVDTAAFEQQKNDEDMARDAARFLWDQVMPRLTHEIRVNSRGQLPHDGKSLTEFIHQYGINCRYLGRLATLAQSEEEKDRKIMNNYKQGKSKELSSHSMPLFWLELLECEMVARAAKHVLDRYLTENGGMVALYPMQTVSSFLCALISSGEETTAQTESRMGKRGGNEPDEDDFTALTLYDAGGDGDAVPDRIRGRSEVWNDIEQEVGRRFRYSLTLFNRTGDNSRALYIPLLRRVCQRTGVRLAAKSYDIGGKCVCSGAGQMAPSYPISPLDIIDIVPLMKHSAAYGGGFTSCSPGNASGLPPLHISLSDARSALESAHVLHKRKQLARALDLAQEAASLYQRVADTSAHPGVVSCIELMGAILLDAGEGALSAGNYSKALGLMVQVKGFDSSDTISFHLWTSQSLLACGKNWEAIKHLRAAIYLIELAGGPNNTELANLYHKVGSIYHGSDDVKTALRFYKEAASRASSNRLMDGMISKSLAVAHASLGDFKIALDAEKVAYRYFSMFLGKDHQLTRASDEALRQYTSAAVHQGSKMQKDLNNQEKEAAADAIASQLEAEEVAAQNKNKKKKNKKKKGKR